MPRRLLPLILGAALLAPLAPALRAQAEEAFHRALRDNPAVRLGARAASLKTKLPVARLVVVAETEGAFCEAIAAWSPQARFPVLYDDGSPEAAEWIARFLRAFGEGRVVRLSEASDAWREGSREQRVGRARRLAWSSDDEPPQGEAAEDEPPGESVPEVMRQAGVAPPGVILAARNDPTWTAALALAAGRGQPLAWIDPPAQGLGATLDSEQTKALRARGEDVAESSGLPWDRLGDEIDALTLCWNGPVKTAGGDKGPMALSDALGRLEDGSRWAWCGIILGGETAASVRAMAPLFLSTREAWLFNGYGADGGFASYEIGDSAELLGRAEFRVLSDEAPRNSPDDFRTRARFGARGGLAHINTSGHRRWFTLGGARATTRDLPLLELPSIVHFVHSFSMQNLADERSIARRLLENGAAALIGAVDEPYLSAFHPPKVFVARLLSSAPLAAAAFRDRAPLWKVNVLGDPLWTLSPAAAPQAPAPELPAGEPLENDLRAALETGDFRIALRLLLMQGRDADVVRLAQALADDQPDALTAPVARLALEPAIRTGQTELLTTLLDPLASTLRDDPRLADLVWLALAPAMETTRNPELIEGMRAIIRDHALAPDAMAVAQASARVLGAGAARTTLRDAIRRTSSEKTRRRLAEALASYER